MLTVETFGVKGLMSCAEVHTERLVGLHLKCQLFLSHFYQNWNVLVDFKIMYW